jgi:RNA polymerase sigma-70 factor (ECF subfamily)
MTEDRLASLYRLHGPAIFARCLGLLRDRAAAEDATQETFLKIHRHLAKAPGDDEVRLWIFRAATNVCISQLRSRKTRTEAVLDAPVPGQSVEALLVDRDLASRLTAGMPEKLAVPAWLHYVDGLDQGEVARVLGVSRRTVIYRLNDFLNEARKRMRSHKP